MSRSTLATTPSKRSEEGASIMRWHPYEGFWVVVFISEALVIAAWVREAMMRRQMRKLEKWERGDGS